MREDRRELQSERKDDSLLVVVMGRPQMGRPVGVVVVWFTEMAACDESPIRAQKRMERMFRPFGFVMRLEEQRKVVLKRKTD